MLEEKSLKRASLSKPSGLSFTKTFVESGLLNEYINMLHTLTNEFKRENVGEPEGDSSESEEEELVVMTAADVASHKAKEQKHVKKGVGYNYAGENTWNIDGYLKNRQEKN